MTPPAVTDEQVERAAAVIAASVPYASSRSPFAMNMAREVLAAAAIPAEPVADPTPEMIEAVRVALGRGLIKKRIGSGDAEVACRAMLKVMHAAHRCDGLRDALRFYVEEVEALTRYASRADKVHSIEAVITVLTLDGGRRGRAALADTGGAK